MLRLCTTIDILDTVNDMNVGHQKSQEKMTGLRQVHCFAGKATVGKTKSLLCILRFSTVLDIVLYYYGGDLRACTSQSWALGSGGKAQAAACCSEGGNSYLRPIMLRNCIFLRKPRRPNIKKRKARARHMMTRKCCLKTMRWLPGNLPSSSCKRPSR